jgi:hypothetical protein
MYVHTYIIYVELTSRFWCSIETLCTFYIYSERPLVLVTPFTKHRFSKLIWSQSPNSKRDSIMPCPLKSNLKKPVYKDQSYGDTYISHLTKNGFHASNRRSLLSEFEFKFVLKSNTKFP